MGPTSAEAPPARLPQRVWRGVRRALRMLGRPVRRDRGLQGVVIQPYRGYGTRDEIYLMGRVFRQPRFGSGLPPGSILKETSDVLRRLGRWGIGEAEVSARFAGVEECFTTDRDGYFHVEIEHGGDLDPAERWHPVQLQVSRKGETATEEGLVYIPPPSARRVIISDIDDTVMHTGVANKAKMLWRLFVQGPESRVAFPGVAALYQGFHEGGKGDEGNPMLYVSRAPWSIYEVLEAFFRLKGIPEGPILFLREWGLTLQRPMPRRAREHKRDLIEEMLRGYDGLPFVLVGDSGQHDPEVYAEVVRDHPDRVAAVYIRDVSREEARGTEIRALWEETEMAGSPLVLAGESLAMAEHAAEAGFIAGEVLDTLAEEQAEARGAPPG